MGLLLLVRHGQASFGAADYDVLSETGAAQARALGAALGAALGGALGDEAPVRVVHGGMQRQRDTAAGLVAAAGWAVPLEVDPRWAEFDHLEVLRQYGESPDGLDRRGFQQLFEAATARWQAESEDWPAFVARGRAALDALAGATGSGQTSLAVTSGGVIAAVVAGLLGPVGPAGQLGAAEAGAWQRLNAVVVNSSVTRVLVGSTGVRLLTFNEHQHVSGDLLTYR